MNDTPSPVDTPPPVEPARTPDPARATGPIVHVLTRLLRGGAEENTVATCRGQLDAGFDVVLIHGDEWDPAFAAELPETLRRIRLPNLKHRISPLQDLRVIGELRRQYRELAPSVVHTHQSKAGVVGRYAAAGLESTVIVHSVHIAPFVNVGTIKRVVYVALERLAARYTDRFISVSRGMRDACLEHGIGQPAHHHVVHSGMDLDRFRDATPPEDWRERLDVESASRPFIVLMLASFEPRKRQHEFLDGLAPWLRECREADRPVLILFGGEGPCEPDVRALARKLDVEPSVRFLGHAADAERWIALADACALSSEREGLPRVAIQYVASGKRLVMMDLPGLDELLDAYTGSTRVTNGDFPAMAAALRRVHDKEFDDSGPARKHASIDLSSWQSSEMVKQIGRIYAKENPLSFGLVSWP